MTYEFMPGDRAILINTGEQYESMRGQVVTIKSPLRAMPTHIGRMMVHEVQPDEIPPGMDNDVFVVPPQLLRPLCRPGPYEPGDWDVISFCSGWDPREEA